MKINIEAANKVTAGGFINNNSDDNPNQFSPFIPAAGAKTCKPPSVATQFFNFQKILNGKLSDKNIRDLPTPDPNY